MRRGAAMTPDDFVYSAIKQFPHCDPRVLHAPGECKYCDRHPEWQALRIVYGIRFTGELAADKSPCPAEQFRTAETIHRWPGNRPNGV